MTILPIPPDVVERLRSANLVTVLTGAGISAESGIPTFREAQTGLWAKYAPEELATPEAFERNPALVWNWYAWRRDLVAGAQPNAGHYALAKLERHVPHFTLITQNVDSLHQRAGSGNTIELHGNLSRVKCYEEDRVIDEWEEQEPPPPHCPNCGGFLRPDVVWFGESLPAAAFRRAIEVSRGADIFLCVGTSGIVQPAASLPLDALATGAMVVEINPSPTSLSHIMSHVIRGPAGLVLPALVDAAWPSNA